MDPKQTEGQSGLNEIGPETALKALKEVNTCYTTSPHANADKLNRKICSKKSPACGYTLSPSRLSFRDERDAPPA
jgi:hypothetical protein